MKTDFMKSYLLLAILTLTLNACSSTVIVKKDTCKDIYGGTLMECEQVKK